MKLQSKLLYSSLITLGIVILIVGAFFYSSNLSKKENEKNSVANQISKNVLELNLLSNEQISEYKERISEQWKQKHQANSELLTSSLFKDEDELNFINNIKKSSEKTEELFLQLSPDLSPEQKKVISSQLSVESQTMASESFQLSNLLREKIDDVNRQTSFLIIFLSIALIGSSLFLGFRTSRSITEPIQYIKQATGEIERGNYRTRINIDTGDELEDLGESFNRTMKVLEALDSKRAGLERAKTEFLSITSHELRSPMTPMRAQLQMLKEEYFGKLNSKQYNSIDIVLRNTNRLDKIIMDLLEVSRIEAARLKFTFVKTNLGEHIRRTIDEMSNFLLEKNIQIIPKLENLPEIEVDPDRVMQVLRNLLENAIKFSGKNNRVILTVKKAGDFIQISVKDHGIGISEESKKRIFEPFYQGESSIYRKYGGTGLGLAICKGIVESQKGKIWFESTEGKGTEFIFLVPLKPVKEIKPIALLFSSSKTNETNLLDVLKEMIGPIAEREMEILREEGITYDKVNKYVKYLKYHKILDDESAVKFEGKIKKAFGKEINVENSEISRLMILAKQREMKIVIQKITFLAFKLYGEVAIRKANSVKGLKVDFNGNVIGIDLNNEERILRELGNIYIDLLGDLTKFIKPKEDLNNKQGLAKIER